MNSLWVVVIGFVVILTMYQLYAKRIDRTVIQADRERPTPARMYMDGVDFVPTSRYVLYGYHFKSIAAAGPIVGVITAAGLWGWLPSIIWLMVGVSLIGWASDYSAIMVAVRNDGNSLSAIAHRLIAPRARSILFVFIFFYLLLVAGAFVGIMAAILAARPDVPFGILVLALAGLAAGYLIYRRKADLIAVTLGVVLVTVLAMGLGPLGAGLDQSPPDWSTGAISGSVKGINDGLNGGGALYTVEDPTGQDPRITRDPATGEPFESATFNPATGLINVLPSYIFWAIFGWHALFGSVGTARQLEYETDALPVGGGGMFSENTLGLLSLTAVAIAGGAGAGAFAAGVGRLIHVASFQTIPLSFGTALGFGAFVVIVLTVVQLVFRVMRVTLGEWLGEWWVGFKNQHVASVFGSVLVLLLVLSGTWVYLWQLFGASNQLLAALSLLLVTLWLAATHRNPADAGIPMLFMYVTTVAASLVTAYNLYVTIVTREGVAAISIIGAWAMILIALLLVVAALLIAWDAWKAWTRYRGAPPEPEPAPAATVG